MMKNLLITGFEPFDNEAINPSWLVTEKLPDVINGYELTKLCLPAVFGEAAKTVISVAEKIDPDVIFTHFRHDQRAIACARYPFISCR